MVNIFLDNILRTVCRKKTKNKIIHHLKATGTTASVVGVVVVTLVQQSHGDDAGGGRYVHLCVPRYRVTRHLVEAFCRTRSLLKRCTPHANTPTAIPMITVVLMRSQRYQNGRICAFSEHASRPNH